MSSPQYSFLSSSGVREVAALGGPVTIRSPSTVARRLAALHSRGLRLTRLRRASLDVLVLIDKLDDLVHDAKAVPLTDQVRIDREDIYEILDQMRSTIPEEIKQARWIVKERQEMLAEAKREAERLIGEARDQAQREASQQEVVKLAERQAHELIEQARLREREVRLGAEDYADGILENLEVNLGKFLAAVQRGREQLASREDGARDTAGFDATG